MAKEALFREKSMERITSPDQMRDHLRVTNPRLWMLLGAIVLLLTGFIVYAAASTIESTYSLKMEFSATGYITGDIPYDQMDHFSVGMPIRIAGETGRLRSVYSSTRILLDLTPDSGSDFEEGLYLMYLRDDENATLEDLYYVRYGSGLWTCSDMSIQQLLDGHDTRVRIWWIEDDIENSEGRLATVSGAKTYMIASVEAVLDSEDTSLNPGTYDAEIVTESTTPISFLLN